MKAATRRKYGGPDVLKVENIESPEPKADEILVKVHYTTVNRTDCHILAGTPFVYRFFLGLFKPKIKVTGSDFAGEIIRVGTRVTNFLIGDRVMAFGDEGFPSHAEYITVKKNSAVVKFSDKVDYSTAAASIEGPHYALNFLNKVDLKSGDRVLVNGATGGIGSAAIQLLKLEGVHVTAVCDTKNISLIRSKGVDRVINYEKEDFTQLKEKFNYVLDAVGKSRFKYCKKLLTDKGGYISSELGPRCENLFLAIFSIFSKGRKVLFPIPTSPKKSLQFMADLLERQEYEPIIDRIYPFEDIAEAFRYVAKGMKTGNVLNKIVD